MTMTTMFLLMVLSLSIKEATPCKLNTPPCKVSSSELELNLRDKLFARYSASLRPLEDDDVIMNVTFNMRLIRLLDIGEKSQRVTSQAYFTMKWHNDYLKWNPDESGGIKHLAVRPDQIWIPDIILKNNAEADDVQIQKGTDAVWIKYDGSNAWYPKVTIRSSFKADVVDFPFDSQRFIFHYGSWSLGEDKLRILTDDKPMIDAHYLQDPEWDLLTSRKETMRTKYDSATYFEVMFTYVVTRKPAYSVITAIVPSIGLMTLTLFCYVLPPNNGERIKVILTSLLAYTVFLVEMNSYLPRNSESVPVIQVFYMVTMSEYILCFIITCVFARLFRNENKNKSLVTVPAWLVKYVLRVRNEDIKYGDMTKYGAYPGKDIDDNKTYEVVPHEENTTITIPETVIMVNGKHPQDVPNGGADGKIVAGKKHIEIQMTWAEFLEHVDRVFMEVLVLTFICTTSIILLPPYWRKYYGSTTDLNE